MYFILKSVTNSSSVIMHIVLIFIKFSELFLWLMIVQIKLLEAWGDMERQHLSAISMTKDSLNSVVCSVPLVQGAKVRPRLN